jgi:hypothetical protein
MCDRLGFDLGGLPTDIQATRPPLIPISPKVTEQYMR